MPSVRALEVCNRVQAMRDARDTFGLEHRQHLVEILVDVTAFIERRALGIADDAADLDSAYLALDLAHLTVDGIVRRFELALGGAAPQQTPGAVVDREAGSRSARLREKDGCARVHRARD